MESDIIDITHFRKERELKDGNRTKTYEEFREHYLLRLKERYNIEITNDEYYDLININMTTSKFIPIYKLSSRKCLIWIKIKGIYVLSLFYGSSNDKKYNVYRPPVLVTCLNLNVNNRVPVPKIFGINGYKSVEFENEINNRLKEVFELQNDYCEMGKINFFKYHKADLPLKTAIHFWNKSGDIDINKLIKSLITKMIKDNKTFKLITR